MGIWTWRTVVPLRTLRRLNDPKKAALVGNFQESTSKVINLDYAAADTIEKMLSFAIGTLAEKDISGDDA